MPTPPVPAPNIPTPVPQTSDPTNFAARADATLTAIPDTVDGLNDLAVNVYDNAVEAHADAVDAEAAKVAAEAARAAALGVTAYVATSASSIEVSAGTKTVHTEETGRAFAVDHAVVLIRASDPDVRLYGVVATSDGSDDYTVDVTSEGVSTAGAGNTYTDWIMAAAWYFQTGATAAEKRAGTSAQVAVTPKTLADDQLFADDGNVTGTYTPDLADGGNHTATLTGNITLEPPAGAKEGDEVWFELVQDATGGRTISIDAAYEFARTPNPDTSANAVNVVKGKVVDAVTPRLVCEFIRGASGGADGWVQIATYTVSGTPATIDFLSIPQTFDDIAFEFAGVTTSGAETFRMAISPNGSSFSGYSPISPTNVTAGNGRVDIPSYRRARGLLVPAVGTVSSDPRVETLATNLKAWRCTGGIQAARFSLNTGNFTAGTITLFGRRNGQ